MATIRKIEDLKVWQEAKLLGKWTYKLADTLPNCENYNLKRHLKENARGCPANISEGFYRHFKKERLHLFDVAKGNLGEIKSDIYFCRDICYIKKELATKYINQINKVEAMLNGFIGTVAHPKTSKTF